MLRRLVEDGKPDYFAVVFDAPGKTFRDDVVPAVQGEPRRDARRSRRAQIEPLHELVRAHGWPLLMVEGVEADDVIGTLAAQAAAAGIDTVISSSDKDLTQLVTPAHQDGQHDEQRDLRRGRRARQVRRAPRPGARSSDAHRRRGRQRARRGQGRAEDRRQVARAIRHARQRHRATRARSAAWSATTCARRCRGCRRASACSPSRPIASCRSRSPDLVIGAARRRHDQGAVRALRVQAVAEGHRRRDSARRRGRDREARRDRCRRAAAGTR